MGKEKKVLNEKKRWSTKAVMTQIYNQHMWGGADYDFYSGTGSHDSKIVTPYVKVVSEFLKSFKEPLTVCDLGCGDFNIGRQLVHYTKKYVAIDVVDALIERNRNFFKENNLTFQCLDICKDEIPNADCLMVRQVMQHLSNTEINTLVEKFKKFKFVIITEHLPSNDFEPNVDKITGQGIRLKKKSGVVITKAPFNLKPSKEELFLEVDYDDKSVIKTIVYQNF